ncbi:MAG: hypothetical protein JJD93_03635 [Ilumatobacteraceae bacterium]|nr:hypothetical protein [Ilumatobacteraceae bacterium]
MFKLPEMPTIDFSSIKLPSIDFSAIDLPAIDFSRLDVNALLDKLPKIDLPAIDTAKLTAAVRDAGYIAVGLGVVAVERAQARGNELTTIVNDRLAEVREFIRSAV